jgi:hypothetical protein
VRQWLFAVAKPEAPPQAARPTVVYNLVDSDKNIVLGFRHIVPKNGKHPATAYAPHQQFRTVAARSTSVMALRTCQGATGLSPRSKFVAAVLTSASRAFATAERSPSRQMRLLAEPLILWPEKGGSMITVEAKRVGTRVIATVKVGISTGRYTYTVQFADQGSEAANEVEAQRELRRTLEEVLEALGPS